MSTTAWDSEYERKGIPSSYRTEPSGSVVWLLDELERLRPGWKPEQAIDVGCGAGRNTRYLGMQGIKALGIDSSAVAIRTARASLAPGEDELVTFQERDLTTGLPMEDASCDIVIDTFVYFHQARGDARAAYRQELMRILRPGGFVLLTLATDEDGFYSTRPQLPDWQEYSHVPIVEDTDARVSNALFSEESLRQEFGSNFEIVMSWRKSFENDMHGGRFRRVTLATIWQRP